MVLLNNTYGYMNFISDEEKNILINWCETNNELFRPFANAYGRNYCILKNVEDPIIKLVSDIKNRIIKLDNIEEWVEEPIFYDYIGINKTGAYIREHTDLNLPGYIHTRYNVILKYPKEGGHSIYDGFTNILEENMVWKCVAGKILHGSTIVIGDTPRITLSLGFQIKSKNFI
jgi:hypothetical protein